MRKHIISLHEDGTYMRQKRINLFLWVAAAAFLILSSYVSMDMEGQQGQVGVRFLEDEVSGERIGHIYEQEENVESLPWVTLWRMKEGVGISRADGGRRAMVKLVELWGGSEHIYPDCLMDGTSMSREDETGCMLSGKAAFEVFGSEDVLGKKVLLDGREYCVRGLLDVDDKLFLRETKEGDFSYVEAEVRAGDGTGSVRRVLAQAGVSAEDGAVLEWDAVRGLLHLLRALAIGLLGLAIVQWLMSRCRERPLWAWGVRIAAVLLFALVLARSWCFSQEFIPGSWSDFDFFGELFRSQWENYVRYLDMPDIFKDHLLFGELRLSLVCIVLSALCGMFCLIHGKWHGNAHIE